MLRSISCLFDIDMSEDSEVLDLSDQGRDHRFFFYSFKTLN